jgi:hypothetical protein
MKTGPARLFFLAKQAGSCVALLPVGLNYERAAIFRSSVVIAIGTPLTPDITLQTHLSNPGASVRDVTEELRMALAKLLFQADNYRDRELLLLLERLIAGHAQDRWSDRLQRLKQFEVALSEFRKTNPAEIEKIRHLLARYHRLASRYGVESESTKTLSPSILVRVAGSLGLLLASVGLVLNWLPYKLVGKLVKWKGFDESDAATFKILYSLGIFPLFYLCEALLVAHFAGGIACLIFCILVLPLSYFTLRFFEWREEVLGPSGRIADWFGGSIASQVEKQLSRLESRILSEVDRLTQT